MLTTKNTGGLVAGKPVNRGLIKMADSVKATRNVAASGKHYEGGQVYQVGKDITPQDAATLLRLGRMVPVASGAPKAENREDNLASKTTQRAPAKKKPAGKKKTAKK